jgi:hypothetical protein
MDSEVDPRTPRWRGSKMKTSRKETSNWRVTYPWLRLRENLYSSLGDELFRQRSG